jgi:hypothetical protein
MIVSAEQIIRITSNSTLTCSAADGVKLDAIVNPIVRRQLRITANTNRELQRSTKDCAEACRNMAICHATGCGGRRILSEENEINRKLQTATCAEQLNTANKKLDALISTNAVSDSCKKVISRTNRKTECFDNVIYGVIENIVLWNLTASATQPVQVTDNMKTGRTICKGMIFTIEAVVNNCVDFVRFEMVGPSDTTYLRDHTEDAVPYALFDASTTGGMLGKQLYHSGYYTLKITPDGDVSKQQVFKLLVKDCSI